MLHKRTRNFQGRNFKKQRQADKLSKARRSNLMSRIRGVNTAFERQFVKAFESACSIEFERNCKRLIGKPDLVFEAQRVCVFIDSAFWHGWQFPRWRHLLKN